MNNKFVIQSRPDAQGVRVFFGMDADPRRAPYSGMLRDEFLMKVGATNDFGVVTTCYDVDVNALLAAGATVIGKGSICFGAIPGDQRAGAWEWEDWMKEFIQS